MPQANNLIQLHEIGVKHGAVWSINNINLRLDKHEIVTLIGPNGAGKSTLVKAILGLIETSTGRVEKSANLKIGYVPQATSVDATLPMTVNSFLRLSPGVHQATIDEALNETGVSHVADTFLHQVSGGELRRILLARALLLKPDLLILDEPTAGVDVGGQASLYQLIQDIRDRYGCGILLVSHDLHIVMAATDRVLCLNKHLCCTGTPDQVQQNPEFLSLFGADQAAQLAVYQHHHDHQHDLHGNVCDHDH